jgi:hypothetical protein
MAKQVIQAGTQASREHSCNYGGYSLNYKEFSPACTDQKRALH